MVIRDDYWRIYFFPLEFLPSFMATVRGVISRAWWTGRRRCWRPRRRTWGRRWRCRSGSGSGWGEWGHTGSMWERKHLIPPNVAAETISLWPQAVFLWTLEGIKAGCGTLWGGGNRKNAQHIVLKKRWWVKKRIKERKEKMDKKRKNTWVRWMTAGPFLYVAKDRG